MALGNRFSTPCLSHLLCSHPTRALFHGSSDILPLLSKGFSLQINLASPNSGSNSQEEKSVCDIIYTSWWLNQPLRKIIGPNWIISPRFGVKTKNACNHHPVYNSLHGPSYSSKITSTELSFQLLRPHSLGEMFLHLHRGNESKKSLFQPSQKCNSRRFAFLSQGFSHPHPKKKKEIPSS